MKHLTKPFAAYSFAASLVLLALVADPRSSAAHSGTAEEQAACTPDVLRLCFFDIPSEERIVACLNRNLADLSPACHDVIAGPDEKKKARGKH